VGDVLLNKVGTRTLLGLSLNKLYIVQANIRKSCGHGA
jgi:hypothetical protein